MRHARTAASLHELELKNGDRCGFARPRSPYQTPAPWKPFTKVIAVTPEQILQFASAILFAGLFVFAVFVNFFVGRLWLRALTGGANITVSDILRMRLRKTDANAVVDALIAARQGGVAVTTAEMERALLQGVDLRKITLAAIEAKKQGMDLTLQELIDADLADQLAEKLGARGRSRR